MKKSIGLIYMVVLLMGNLSATWAQKYDAARMERDVVVAQDVLSTVLKQQFDRKNFFPLQVTGQFREGYGVIFRLPADFVMAIGYSPTVTAPTRVVVDGNRVNSYSYSLSGDVVMGTATEASKESARKVNIDSVRDAYSEKVIQGCKTFIADYGDLLSQLQPNERIIITNQGDHSGGWYSSSRKFFKAEVSRGDIQQYKQGKLSREQLLSKIQVVNSEVSNEAAPDFDLLTTIFNRLYHRDLSKTYFCDSRIYFERLKDYGVIYYMDVFSSNDMGNGKLSMPTQRVTDLDQASRDKKVTELFPAFEKDLKQNILEYGRTLRNLGNDESLIFNVKLTKCVGCGIPSTMEVSVKGSVLQDYGTGKIDLNTAMSKMAVVKGSKQ